MKLRLALLALGVVSVSVGCGGASRSAAAICADREQATKDVQTALQTYAHTWHHTADGSKWDFYSEPSPARGTIAPDFENPDDAKLYAKFASKEDRLIAQCQAATAAEFRARADK